MKHHVKASAGPLLGMIRVPGDKSISHRAVLFAAMADGRSRLTGVLDSADVRRTIDAVRILGAEIEASPADDGSLDVTVTGWGELGPTEPTSPIDCGNSGTTTRLLFGMLAGWPITATLYGDESLSRRPMLRVTEPLSTMGASFTTRDGMLPATVEGGGLHAIEYPSPVASAQVKTAVLLAGLRATGRTTVVEPAPSRDHTERMLPDFGVPVEVDAAACSASVTGPAALHACDVAVPGDPSSAAFLIAAALIVRGSEITLPDVALNPTRIGFLRVLQRMGADITVDVDETSGGELSGTITARHRLSLTATTVLAEEIPSLVDEVPILAVVAARALGTTRFEGVGELRVKESDRLQAIYDTFGELGVAVSIERDALEVTGPGGFAAAEVDSLGDHRLAMAWAIAGLVGEGEMIVRRFEAVDVSYPRFLDDLAMLGAR